MPNINQQSLLSVTKDLTVTRKTNPQCWFSSKTIKKQQRYRMKDQEEMEHNQRKIKHKGRREKTRNKQTNKQEEGKEQSTLKIVTYNIQNKF